MPSSASKKNHPPPNSHRIWPTSKPSACVTSSPTQMALTFFLTIRRPPRSPLFPSTTLFRSGLIQASDGKLYGVTSEGGNASGAGTAFSLQVQFSYVLTVSTSGDGSVASRDGFIICPGTCSHTYPANTPVTLDATPGQGWVFGGWNGACLGTGSCTVTMTQPLSVDAIF